MKDKLVVLTGPTAVGKTSASIAIAKALNGEIISADSMQIYEYMNIGTAKVRPEEMDGITHHMIDILKPDEEFSAALYNQMARKIIHDINARDSIPIVTGGTGLYINSLVYDLDFGGVPPQGNFRSELEAIFTEYGGEHLLEILRKVDPDTASRLAHNDFKRIARALEVFEFSGVPLSRQVGSFRKETENYDLAMYCLTMDRTKLYERINSRVDLMFEEGLLNEVKYLLDSGYGKQLTSMQGIGYKELCGFLNEEATWQNTIEKIKQGTRNYAKRQLTWFRRDNRIKWIDVEKFSSNNDLHNFLIDDIRKTLYNKEGQ